jgi:hypothetical protein
MSISWNLKTIEHFQKRFSMETEQQLVPSWRDLSMSGFKPSDNFSEFQAWGKTCWHLISFLHVGCYRLTERMLGFSACRWVCRSYRWRQVLCKSKRLLYSLTFTIAGMPRSCTVSLQASRYRKRRQGFIEQPMLAQTAPAQIRAIVTSS